MLPSSIRAAANWMFARYRSRSRPSCAKVIRTATVVETAARTTTAAASAASAGRRRHQRQVAAHRSHRPGLDRFAPSEPLQFVGQFTGGLIPFRRFFLQAFQADGLEVARHTRDSTRGATPVPGPAPVAPRAVRLSAMNGGRLVTR